jgi:hypothetical protein
MAWAHLGALAHALGVAAGAAVHGVAEPDALERALGARLGFSAPRPESRAR